MLNYIITTAITIIIVAIFVYYMLRSAIKISDKSKSVKITLIFSLIYGAMYIIASFTGGMMLNFTIILYGVSVAVMSFVMIERLFKVIGRGVKQLIYIVAKMFKIK